MNVVELTETEAFKKGSDLWIIKNDPNNKWWKELDFRSGFLLSHCVAHHKKDFHEKLNEILELTEMKKLSLSQDENFLLLGSSDHFLNKWILIWNSSVEKTLIKIFETMNSQKTNSVRFFSDSETLMNLIEARPKTSSIDVSYIENT